MYKTYYQVNKNLSNAIVNLMGEVARPCGDVEVTQCQVFIDRLTRLNKEEVRKYVSKNQAELYEEEVSEMINEKHFKPFEVYKRGTNETPKRYLNVDEVSSLLVEMTMLANNMLNAEEE